jgi:hypothetical protein
VIVPSPDGRRVSWVDFRDYTGVFVDLDRRIGSNDEGRCWDLPDLHFGREQYIAEIERASADGSWETSRRRTARLHDPDQAAEDMAHQLLSTSPEGWTNSFGWRPSRR